MGPRSPVSTASLSPLELSFAPASSETGEIRRFRFSRSFNQWFFAIWKRYVVNFPVGR